MKHLLRNHLLLFLTLSACAAPPQQFLHPGQGCTVFYAASGDTVLAGNNEDYLIPLTRVWFIPASEGKHGRVIFGFDDLQPQGGMNDQGLFFDGLMVPYKPLSQPDQKPPFPGAPAAILDDILARNATVEDVLAYIEPYSRAGMETSQLFLGDRFGNSAIVEGEAILRKTGSYQVAANFRLSEYPDPPYPSDRYITADSRLSQAAGVYTVDLFRDILDATHQSDNTIQTVYSQVYDLKRGLIYLYHYHDYEYGLTLNLTDELAKGARMLDIAALFPPNPDYEQWAEKKTNQWKNEFASRVDTAAPSTDLASLTGEYRAEGDNPDNTVRITEESGRLVYQRSYELPLELFPAKAGGYFHPFFSGTELKLAFQRDTAGKVVSVTLQRLADGGQVIENRILSRVRGLPINSVPDRTCS